MSAVDIGPFELIGGGVLALLAMIVVMSLSIVVLWATALTVVAPTMAAVDAGVQHKRWRDWRRGVRDSWLTGPDGSAPLESADPSPPPVRGAGLVRSHDAGVDVQLIAAQLPPTNADLGRIFSSIAMVHARFGPSTQLELPPHANDNIVVYVLAGHGTVGIQERLVRAGQLAVLGPGTPVRLTASANRQSPALEVFVLDQLPSGHALPRGELVVRDVDAAMRRRLRALQALTDTLAPSGAEAGPPGRGRPASAA